MLSIVGLGAGALTLGFQIKTQSDIREANNAVASAETHATSTLTEFTAHREKLFQSLRDTLNAPGHVSSVDTDIFLNKLEDYIQDLEVEFNSTHIISSDSQNSIYNLRKPICSIYPTQFRIQIVHSDSIANIDDLSKYRLMLDDAMNKAIEAVNKLEGKQRLKGSLIQRKYAKATPETATDIAATYMNHEADITHIRNLITELSNIQVLAERLFGETKQDQLISLKDNQLRQSFTRLFSASNKVDDQFNSNTTSNIQIIKDIILGEDAVENSQYQTITAGANSLYTLKKNRFILDNKIAIEHERISKLLNECIEAEKGLFKSLSIATNNNSILADDKLHSTLQNTLIFASVISVFYLVLASHIARLGNKAQTDLYNSNVELLIAQQEAEQASKAKSEFLANMSHEIRTPMTAILGFADTIRDTGNLDLAPKERIEAIDTIKRNGEHLLTIINDILDISKIEAGKLEVEHIECNPIQIVADVHSLMQVRAQSKNIEFKLDFQCPLPAKISSDPTRLRQILINIVGNAIKFTELGSVTMRTTLENEDTDNPILRFDIIDTGIGLSKEQVSKLFGAFTQADTSTSRKFGGTGLGLNISKRLSELLGGNITITSTPGEGSTFSITIATGSLNETQYVYDAKKALSINEEPNPTKAKPSKVNANILLAEDGPDNQKLIGFVLKKAGATVTIVENGKLALETALKAKNNGEPFDIIFMDMQMPIMGGYEATTKLRQAGYNRPIIALTAHAMQSDREKCINAGCDDYTTKPINKKKLIELIHTYTDPNRDHQSQQAA